ncbi:MAG: hypothetical protein KGJ23_12105 [Euryarchaeota archaeon]|nr:hypothetical protein [Euryarchaeota archaeon]MDE1837340.1 hypothetical protein [Euryarchaeota archaeon]MDE1880928.1 hypothetical protein [Euryarchaeota archaeon]MDE2045618.1 hypothetical protein [Thermoplasmata archaeon]
MDPRKKCLIEPILGHPLEMLFDRGLAWTDVERMVREGIWVAEGGPAYDIVYREWHIKVKLLQCLIRVKTAFPGVRR